MKNLFNSHTAYKLIDFFVKNQDKEYYSGELSRAVSADPANTIRELEKLVEEDVINFRKQDNKKYYFLNKKCLYINDLISIFEKMNIKDIEKKFKTDWLLAEEIMNICPFFTQIWLNCFVDEFVEPGGKPYKKIAAIFKGYNLWFYFDKKDACEVGEHITQKFYSNPEFMAETNHKIVEHADILRFFADTIPDTNLNRLSDQDLIDIYKKHESIHTEYYQWSWLPVAADMFCNNLTDKGKEVLKNLGVDDDNIDTNLTLLTTPIEPSLIKIEHDELVKIGIKVQKNKKDFDLCLELFKKFKEEDAKEFGLYTHSPEYEKKFEELVATLKNKISPKILNELQKHYLKYYYSKFIFTEEQGVYSFEYYLKSLVRLVSSDNNLEKSLQVEDLRIKSDMVKRNELIKQLKLSENNKKFFTEWGNFMITKIYRRYAQIYAVYKMFPVIEEIGERIGLTAKETKFMTTSELKDALINNNLNQEIVKSRVDYCIYYADKDTNVFYDGDKAKKIAKYIQNENIGNVSELKGQCGCRGNATGRVKIVNVVEDMQKMEKGDILVSISTQPDLLPAMKKASAFITDQGGVTSHAAIVAREMNTPCVIATKIATKVLKDGDMVEVNADKGIVKILKKLK